MEELDLLKKDWQKSEASFEQLSEKDIYKMIHKKSSSIVKWILIVSILEFVILNGIGLLIPDNHSEDIYKIDYYLNILQLVSYIITFFFIYLFYKNYYSISTTSTTKKLMETILRTRKTVQYYIGYNLFYFFLIILFISVNVLIKDPIVVKKTENHFLYAFCLIMFLTLIIIGVFGLFYRLIYGFLLKKLKKNYQELQKIDS